MNLALVGLLGLQLLVLAAATAVHALGHAAGARAAGFRVVRVCLGPLAAAGTPRGWRLRLRSRLPAGSGMQADPVHPDGLRGRHAAMIAGGPAAHVALAMLAIAVAAVHGGLPFWLSAGTVTAGALASVTPVALRRGARWTDGGWLLAWLIRPEAAAQRLASSALQLSLGRGLRPRDWDERWARLADGGPRRPGDRVQVAGCVLAYARALDMRETDRAAACLTRAFAGRRLLPARARPALAIEAAFFVARFRGDHELAARLLEADVRGPLPSLAADLERARAAVHLACRRRQEAAAACERALAALARPGRRPARLVDLDRELVMEMLEEARGPAVAREVAPAS